MMNLIFATVLAIFKKNLLLKLYGVFETNISEAKIIYFHTRSLNDKKASLYLYDLLSDLINIIIFASIANYFTQRIMGYKYLGLFIGLMIILIKLVRMIKSVDRAKSELLEELNKFLFIYEMEQIIGSNLFNAISVSAKEISYIEVRDNIDDYIIEFEKLFKLTKWVVIKRMIILIEQNKNFTSRELGLNFLNVSDELSNKYYERKKLELEKKENLMLIPMSINLVLMIFYLLSPFIINFL